MAPYIEYLLENSSVASTPKDLVVQECGPYPEDCLRVHLGVLYLKERLWYKNMNKDGIKDSVGRWSVI